MSTNNILVDFNMIIDTDLCLLNHIKKEYKDSSYFNNYIYSLDNKTAIYQFLNNDSNNPMGILLKKEYKDSANSLYTEFIENEYSDILKYNKRTSLYELINTYILTGAAVIDIMCKNKLEEQIINNFDLKINTIMIDEYSKVDITKYDSIFIKDYSEVIKFRNLVAKNIFIGNYKFNFDNDNIPLQDVSILVGSDNIVNVIDVYESNKYIKIEG